MLVHAFTPSTRMLNLGVDDLAKLQEECKANNTFGYYVRKSALPPTQYKPGMVFPVEGNLGTKWKCTYTNDKGEVFRTEEYDSPAAAKQAMRTEVAILNLGS